MEATVDAVLAKATARTSKRTLYEEHVAARCAAAAANLEFMAIKTTRRLEFGVYQREQRAAKKLATDLLGGLSPLSTLVVWGNGSFGPTSRGHAPAPNKKLQHLLARYVPVLTSSEYNTSKRSACCHEEMDDKRKEGQRCRTTVRTNPPNKTQQHAHTSLIRLLLRLLASRARLAPSPRARRMNQHAKPDNR
jgi:hypothetical protein